MAKTVFEIAKEMEHFYDVFYREYDRMELTFNIHGLIEVIVWKGDESDEIDVRRFNLKSITEGFEFNEGFDMQDIIVTFESTDFGFTDTCYFMTVRISDWVGIENYTEEMVRKQLNL